MNDPIISPWLIYLISLLEPLHIFAAVAGVLGAVFTVLNIIAPLDSHGEERNKYGLTNCSKMFLTVGITGILLAIFIPQPNTVYKMIAASYITPANIQATGELADKAVDKVIDKIADAIQKFERSEKK